SASHRREGRHDLAWPHLLNALGDDELALFEPRRDDDVAALLGPSGDPPQLDFLGVVDEEDVAAGLIDLDRGLRNEEGRPWRTAFHRDPDDATWDQEPVRIRKLRAHRHRVGRVGDLDVEEVAHALRLIHAAVRELEAHDDVRAAFSRNPAL